MQLIVVEYTHENESGTLCLLVTTEFEVLASLESKLRLVLALRAF